jgi:hypothetical protein
LNVQDGGMLVLRATKRLRQRIGSPTVMEGEQSTPLLGDWYATALPWRPQVALLVNATTLLPVLIPLAPAATMTARLADQIGIVLAAHGTPDVTIQAELEHMRDCWIAPTINRSIVGVMNEFAFLANTYCAAACPNLLNLAIRLAATPCQPALPAAHQPRP